MHVGRRAGEMIPEVEGNRLWGPRGKGSPSVSKGPKPPIQLLLIAVAKKQSKRSKRAHFHYILGPPGPTQEMESMGPGGEGPSRSTPVSPVMVGRGHMDAVDAVEAVEMTVDALYDVSFCTQFADI